MQDRSAPAGWAQKFPFAISFSACVSQRLIGDDALELRVLALELLQALGVVGLHPAVLVAPAVIRRLRDLQGLADLRDRAALAEHPVGFSQLADDLLRGVPALLHVIVPVSPMIVDA